MYTYISEAWRELFVNSSLVLVNSRGVISEEWSGTSKHSLATLDAIQRRAIRLIGDPAILTLSTPWPLVGLSPNLLFFKDTTMAFVLMR